MDQEKLIELVREYSYLYDMNDRFYSDNKKKDDAWNEIAEELQVSYTECKKAWALLRDSFRRARKKQKAAKNGQTSAFKKKWKYDEEMSFLLPYITERPGNHKDECSDTEKNCSDASDQERSVSPEVQITPPAKQPKNTKAKARLSTSRNNFKSSLRHRRAMIQNCTNETSSNALMKFMIENKAERNDIQQFFDSIATTVQSFPPQDRAIAKAKVFAVISQMEIEILARASTHIEYGSSPALTNCDPLKYEL